LTRSDELRTAHEGCVLVAAGFAVLHGRPADVQATILNQRRY
jgi:hypothetical protein